jgi:hypothetical protein
LTTTVVDCPASNVGESKATTPDDGALTAEQALRRKVELLQRGRDFLKSIPDYTAQMSKQEVVRGQLLDEQTIFVKCRHQPFSVYLLWLTSDVGREVLYVDGSNNGKMIAHDGGWKARIPALTLPTDGTLAMRDARYPVTTAGLLGLIDIMLGVHEADLVQANYASCELDLSQSFDGRPCLTFTTCYKSPETSPVYRKSITLIDQEHSVALYTRHFEWPNRGAKYAEAELDDATLTESYKFTEMSFDRHLSELDFDRTNPEYRFR